jgi:hypothetical protein
MVIIGLILAFVLVAAMDTTRRAEERATQTLITKLENGLNDRLEALIQNRPDANYAHGYLAAIYNSSSPTGMIPQYPYQVRQTLRAQAIALADYIKSELPDVFFVQQDPNGASASAPYGYYPINFTGVPYPGAPDAALSAPLSNYANVILPLGNDLQNNPPNSFGDDVTTNPPLGFSGSGIFGASYPIAAAIYKSLGYMPTGYDGVDNNGDGLVDDWFEGVNSQNLAQVTANLQNHRHITARSEMLYAILVEGRGPFGSVFSRDEFTDKEVQDTDGDGLPEFVDAWGQPLQFFRWPLLYHSDLERGQAIVPDPNTSQTWDLVPPYVTVYEEREQDPLDVNQQLVAPAWWSQTGVGGQVAANNSSPFPTGPAANAGASNGVCAFESLFHLLTEPYPNPNPATGQFWDRGGFPYRRAYYSKFLILSAGHDQLPGVFLYSDSALQQLVGQGAATASSSLLANENNAMTFGMDLFSGSGGFASNVSVSSTTFTNTSSSDPTNPTTYDLQQAGQDDISNHNLQSAGAIGGS